MSSGSHLAKRFVIVGAILVAAFGALAWYQLDYKPAQQKASQTAPPPVTVSTVEAKSEDWHPWLSSVGSLRAVNGVNIASEVDGIVVEIAFESGQEVEGGTLLLRLDDSVEQADLKNNQAALKNAELTLERGQTLFKKGDYPKAKLDEVQAERDQAAAEVERVKALIAEKHIHAPFTGRIGIRQVDLGEYISAGTTIVGLQALDPIYVDFSLPEQQLSKLANGQPVTISVDAFPGQSFNGKISSLDSRVNENTRNILVRGTIGNDELELLPGMFAAVRVVLPRQEAVVTVPATAVTYGLYGDSVYVVTESKDGKSGNGQPSLVANRRVVKVGRSREDSVAILEGVKAGEQVVSAGQIKLQNGANVKIDNSVALDPPKVRPKE